MWIAVGIIAGGIILISLASCIKIAGDISREEEKREFEAEIRNRKSV
jgi:hypothetical protein